MPTSCDVARKRQPYIGSASARIDIGQYARLVFLSGLSFVAIANSETAHAQNQSDSISLLNNFSNEMKTKALKDPADDAPIPIRNNQINSGYYRIVLEEKNVPNKLSFNDCTKDFESIPDGKFLDVLFEKKFDAGLAVILPLGLKGVDGKESTAELNLIQWKRGAGKSCLFAPSNFLLIPRKKYVGPWVTIDHDLLGAITTNVTFRPWIIQSENSERKAAFWTGVSAVASLFGPVGKLLFGDESDKYSIRSQTELSLFGGKSGVFTGTAENSEAGKFYGQSLTIKPESITQDSVPKRRKFSFIWDAGGEQGRNSAAEKKSFQYDFSVEYLGSIFGEGEEYPNFSDSAGLQAVLGRTIRPAPLQAALEKSDWLRVGGALGNLREQTTADAFQAACNPAKTQLTDLGVSEDDATILVFATAKFSEHDAVKKGIANIKCLTAVPTQKTLERFGVAFDLYQQLELTTLQRASIMSRKSWTKEAKWENDGILGLMSNKAIIYDEKGLIRMFEAPAKPAFSSSISMTEVELKTAINAAQGAKASGCSLATLADNKAFQFPNTPSGDEPKSGWIIHLLEDAMGDAFLVAAGFAGQRTKPGATEASAVLSHIWFGKPEDLTEDIWSNIKTALTQKGVADNCGRNSFKKIIAYQHPVEQAVAPSM